MKQINSVNAPTSTEIDVRFADGHNETHTMEVFFELIADPTVEWIADNTTGELYLSVEQDKITAK